MFPFNLVTLRQRVCMGLQDFSTSSGSAVPCPGLQQLLPEKSLLKQAASCQSAQQGQAWLGGLALRV